MFWVNPDDDVRGEYPPAAECFPARHSDVQIEKIASAERMSPGDAFTYTIVAENVSDDSAAEGIVITDKIPANIRITDVSWVGDSDPDTFPNYTDCAVTGQAAGGYGGTLTCTLFGPLQPAGAGLGAVGRTGDHPCGGVQPEHDRDEIENMAVVDYHTFGDPADSGVTRTTRRSICRSLPLTGSPLGGRVDLGASSALFGGVLLVHVTRRRRNGVIERRCDARPSMAKGDGPS